MTIDVLDENGQPTPARFGIYDNSGRLPLPSKEAIALRNSLSGTTRIMRFDTSAHPQLPPWPFENRSAFYSDGRYHARLPAGDYELIVAKSPEYRFARQ